MSSLYFDLLHIYRTRGMRIDVSIPMVRRSLLAINFVGNTMA